MKLFMMLATCLGLTVCSSHIQNLSATKTGTYLLHTSSHARTIFYDPASEVFYVLQTTQKLDVPTTCTFVAYEKKGALTIRDEASNSSTAYVLNTTTYGISAMKGKKYAEKLLTTDSKNRISFVNNIDDVFVGAFACVCHGVGTSHLCQHGGPGSSGCSVTDGGSVGVGWENGCSVSCNTGYYACCNE